MNIISAIVDGSVAIANFLWGPWTQIALLVIGAYLMIGTKFYAVRKFGYVMKTTLGMLFHKQTTQTKGLTQVQAVMGALAGTIGMGNIAGTATAIAIGGPGAVFWMWIFAFFAMTVKCAEVTLAVHYREVSPDGEIHGGPMFYMEKAIGSKLLSKLFSFGLFVNAILMASVMQIHTVVDSAQSTYGWNPYIVAGVLCLILIFACIGGLKSVGKVCGTLVPIMSLVWIITGIVVVVAKIGNLPHAFGLIFGNAFTGSSAVGGFAGSTIALAIKQGASRATGSNDAGLGLAPCVHATADVEHPFKQGMWGITEVFIDTIVVCTFTALIILLPIDVWHSGATGVSLTLEGLRSVLPTGLADIIVNVCVAAFCFSTTVVFYVYFEDASNNLFGKKPFKYLRWAFFLFPVIFAGYGNVNNLFDGFANMATGLCLWPNLIAIVILSKPFFGLLKDYESGERLYDTAKIDPTGNFILKK